ncbi:MAG: ABC transporter ATP-binding protein [Firmicutes bacterium]|jgi:putative ABC transport system ATP-binding protein|nr:ABC transporter ATP-binding protein [Bacillota bacterium]MDD4335870.1 ABC transporter ATP-binding protein [Bacillota bacterium]MDD4792228.1 ABC transporter ATP-binding protein [Bacillota bacterium]
MVEIESLYKSYSNGLNVTEVLHDVSLGISAGEFVSIMGPSGSGKSTLMNIIGCLDRFDRGSYHLEGLDIAEASDNRLAEIRNMHVGFVFQSFNLLPQYNAVENVELPLLYADETPRAARQKAGELLEFLGLGHRLNHKPCQLSGGEKQRVAIARAVVNSPSLVLADEPTGSLDSKTGSEVLEMFRKLNEAGKTVILVTHSREIAEEAQRIVHIKDGVVSEASHAG